MEDQKHPLERSAPKPDRSAAVNALLDKYQGERVLLITDVNHYDTIENQSFAFDVARAGASKNLHAIALEGIPFAHQSVLDALASGEITRKEFLELYSWIPHTFLTTEQEKVDYFSEVADLIQGGVKVHASGSMVGMLGAGTDASDAIQRIESLYMEVDLDFIKHRRGNGNPSATPEEIELEKQSFYKAHRNNDTIMELFKQVKPDESGKSLTHLRQTDDVNIARRVKEILPENGGLILVYGLGHTIHEHDIDSTLRQEGVSVLIVDPNLADKGDLCAGLSAKMCETIPSLDRWALEMVKRDGDPNRFAIPDTKADPAEINPAPKPNVFERFLWGMGL